MTARTPKAPGGPLPAADNDWRHQGLCAAHGDPDLWFPVGTTPEEAQKEADAKAICGTCPVKEMCLTWALETGQSDGVWGGLNEAQRRALRRARGARAVEAKALMATYGTELAAWHAEGATLNRIMGRLATRKPEDTPSRPAVRLAYKLLGLPLTHEQDPHYTAGDHTSPAADKALKHLARITEMRAKGVAYTTVAEEIGVSDSTIRNVIRRHQNSILPDLTLTGATQ